MRAVWCATVALFATAVAADIEQTRDALTKHSASIKLASLSRL